MLRNLALGASVAGIAYLAFALSRVREFGRARHERAQRTPAVTILKPLHGVDEQLYENLCSFCDQDYPDFRVVFTVAGASDPATPVARQVVARFPERAELLVGSAELRAANPKIANLAAASTRASGEVIAIADADMRVDREYLRAIVAPFADDGVGAATCLYAGSASSDTISSLAAMFINEQFAPSVLVARALEPLAYCFGATIAVRRTLFEEIGGFAALADHVADDHRLGRLVVEHGARVVLSRYVVENVLRETSLRTLWSRELRWSRTIRSVRPLGHALSLVTFGLPLALLGALATRRTLAGFLLVASASALRFALHRAASEALEIRRPPSSLLIPLRDALSLAIWLSSFFGRRVTWREAKLQLDAHGRIESMR